MKLYYRWARPRDGILRVEVGGISGKFYVRTPVQLRAFEALGIAKNHRAILDLELLLSILHPGDIVYDIGSNIGLYPVLLAKAVRDNGQVIAFEPESQSYEHLQDNLRLNGLTNVRTFQKALGDWSGEAILYRGEKGDSNLIRPAKIEMDSSVVEVVEGDRFLEAEALPLPRVLKIDVEGYEYAVIRGLRQTLADPACELVCCEIHPQLLPTELKPEAVLALLKSLGFRRIDTYPRGDQFFAVGYKTDPQHDRE